MDDKLKDYIVCKMQKANLALKEAKLLFENEMYDTSPSRLYYSLFYAASALLISKNLNPKTHSGIKSLLIRNSF